MENLAMLSRQSKVESLESRSLVGAESLDSRLLTLASRPFYLTGFCCH
jgi:hypothetical protein